MLTAHATVSRHRRWWWWSLAGMLAGPAGACTTCRPAVLAQVVTADFWIVLTAVLLPVAVAVWIAFAVGVQIDD